MKAYLGIDVGSVSTKFVLVDEKEKVLFHSYFKTQGRPIEAIKKGLKELEGFIKRHNPKIEIAGVGTTGSARYLAGVIVGADLIKNEITAHAKGVVKFVPNVRTVIEIGGQDSKIIILENGVVTDFAMNLVCSAGTGAFLESDMIHKQQMGHKIEDIIAGLCEGLARNYLSGVGKGKKILPPIVFLGGVSENVGMRWAFERQLGQKIIVPPYNTVMGAYGVALLVKEMKLEKTKFRGFEVSDMEITCTSFQCKGCPNQCEVIEARIEGKVVARWGDRCGRWSNLNYD